MITNKVVNRSNDDNLNNEIIIIIKLIIYEEF